MLNIFERPNTAGGWKCPICKTDKDSSVVLIPISDTEDESIAQAEQFHTECLDLWVIKDKDKNEGFSVIYQMYDPPPVSFK